MEIEGGLKLLTQLNGGKKLYWPNGRVKKKLIKVLDF